MSRPRPRPKPRQKSEASSSATPSKDDDDDSFFIRNSKRTQKEWDELNRLDEASDSRADQGASSDDGTSPRSRKYRRVAHGSSYDLPQANTRMDPAKLHAIMSQKVDETDSSDSGIEVIDDSDSELHQRRRKKLKGKEPKKRSRSRSLTPPPKITESQRADVRRLVQTTLGGGLRKYHFTHEDMEESQDDIVLDPELLKIKLAAQEQSRRQTSVPAQQDMDEEILLTITWNYHPKERRKEVKQWKLNVDRNYQFSKLIDQIGQSMLINSPREALYLSHDSMKVYHWMTVRNLNTKSDVTIEACTLETHQYIQVHGFDHSSLESESETDDASAPSGQPTIQLVLKPPDGKDVTLVVRTSATCEAIVLLFLKKTGNADKYAPKSNKPLPQLRIDGERMGGDASIADTDLEDGDVVEIVGL